MDMGKPIDEAEWDMDDVATCFDYYAGQAEALDARNASAPPIDVGMKEFEVRVKREALGVVGLITPWNYPLLMATDVTTRPNSSVVWVPGSPLPM
ncbi:hypothetical protein HYH03_008763 [Edaphochlamys debaryana]|uniref:Aldehyde dehydrogenase domain-containing protein n=1 Tax=Edaphochlamys debaryana TaxID=47281 RepID=A0A835Y5Z3_9CHLO|nr:hypothetical protein HYH03_008763 [Edaphochlamys debaryana]|eukprot:KAG2493100.1 hypothetical protein HYH03_008763 [Edaphochlamys debaryana]